jgi:hypothetical protein
VEVPHLSSDEHIRKYLKLSSFVIRNINVIGFTPTSLEDTEFWSTVISEEEKSGSIQTEKVNLVFYQQLRSIIHYFIIT